MRIAHVVLTLLLLATPSLAQRPSPQPSSAAEAEAEVREAQRRRFSAMTRNDAAALERLLSDDLVYTHSTGESQSKTELLRALTTGALRYVALEAEQVRVRVYGDVGIITGLATMTVQLPGGQQTVRARFTDVYARREGEWRLVAWQSTRVPEPKRADEGSR